MTISDRGHRGVYRDLSGPAIRDLVMGALADLSSSQVIVELEAIVPDERAVIAETLRDWADQAGLDLVLTSGGTGFGPRDVTPEATRDVVERLAPGLAEAMRAASLRITDLSRPLGVL